MSSFRSIRPSSSSHNTNHPDDNNPLSPSIQSETSNSSFPQSSSVADTNVSVGKGRKRKAPQSVSQNACTNCKRARAKVRLLFHSFQRCAYCPGFHLHCCHEQGICDGAAKLSAVQTASCQISWNIAVYHAMLMMSFISRFPVCARNLIVSFSFRTYPDVS